MIMDFLGVNVGQCSEANKRFGRIESRGNGPSGIKGIGQFLQIL